MLFLSVLTTLAAASTASAAGASAWASSADGKYKLSSYTAPVLGAGNPGISDWKFTIKEKTGKKQVVKGFGACVTDATVSAFNKLSGNLRTQLLNDLMTSAGLNFNLLRHSIASSDLSADPAYSYADNGNQPDPNLNSFGLGDRGNAMVSMLAEMRKLQPQMTLLGSPWAPPGWMQKDGVIIGTTQNNNLNHQYVNAYANYFVKYLQAYEKGGAHVDAITIQNEPFNSRAGMPTMYIDANESGTLIRDNIGPALRNAGLNTQVWAWDHNQDVPSYPQTVINTASQYVQATGWHCYAGNDPDHWKVLTDFHNQFPNKEQYMTECWTAVGTTDWIHSSSFTMMPLQNWANGIIAWTLGSFTGGGPALSGGDACHQCTGIVTVSPDGSGYKKEIDYYMMGQFSKYIPKGATVVDGTGSYLFDANTGLESVATINPDGTRTVVIQNRYNNDVWVSVQAESEGQPWGGRVPSRSVTTWVLPKA
ncbi:Endo-1,6-beta-D-glucanase [Cladobotryum mycophilum]|uniref:Endo-1,6-beta-D-glucanase n=1 Tax=Cladobotryum mycophilum TaxID=491253 RepID=A0ABR0SWV9_9HYPO